ncbi:LysR family transcriptional regulator [Reinekea marina]|uniref:LysR family transcriptional regulator n=1 Tax=Reinekea marina TaxID=1310421 RepID=A0ABV7WWG1_9GAMM|nr:LysR family transcriptional regulator [Reinekea marina]MDN3648822.1 LysR family transcriptional regulator [Reinekea marina]
MHSELHAIDWTEVQTLICVAQLGSLSAASRALGVNHSTVLRRIQSFEQKHHVQLFIRSQTGYELSRHGQVLLQGHEQIEQMMLGLQRRVHDFDSELQGPITVTTTENLFRSYLSKPLLSFARIYPMIELDLLISNQIVDIDHLEADIAIRPSAQVPESSFGFELFSLQFYAYAPKEKLTEIDAEVPFEYEHWVGYSGHLKNARIGKILQDNLKHRLTISANNFDGVAAAANDGLGLALLPSFIGNAQPNLTKVNNIIYFETPVFALAPEDLSVSRRVNALLNYLNSCFQGD